MRVFFFILLVFVSSKVLSQGKYWVYESINQDFTLADSLSDWGISTSYHSTWVNAYSITIDSTQLHWLKTRLPNVKIEKAGFLVPLSIDNAQETLGYALEQINGDVIINAGLTGKGVKIGIIDGGFLNAPKSPTLSPLFKRNHIKKYKDFITPKLKAFGGNKKLDDQHGTDVWEMIAGIDQNKNIQFGLATKSEYYLARTDHGAGEKRIEEEYFIEALEWLAKFDVKLVNTSLGYTNGYDNPKENYTPSQMNGSTAIAKATQFAIDHYDMTIVGAAGNEGNLPWKVINTPADAPGVITVGASKNKLLDRMGYSSIGPDFLTYLKPELTCFSPTGTSFSAPIITGLIACMKEHSPSLNQKEIKSILLKSGDLYPYGNNYIGYGNPNAKKILNFLNTGESIISDVKVIHKRKRWYNFKNKKSFKSNGSPIVVYHKYDHWKVTERKLIISDRKRATIAQPNNITQTTVIIDRDITEIFWH